MRYSFLIFTLIISGFIAEAQVSGYLGKRFTVGYKFQVSPVLMNTDNRNRSSGINVFHDAEICYTVSGSGSLLLMYQRSKAGFTATQDGFNLVSQNDFSDNRFFNYNKDKFAIRYLNTRRGAIAPIGAYMGYGLYVAKLTSHSPSKTPLEAPFGLASESPNFASYDLPVSWDVGFEMFIGRKYVIADLLLIDLGVELSVLNTHLINIAFYDMQNDGYLDEPRTNYEKIRNNMRYRDYFHDILRVYAGVHFLIF